MKYYIIDRKGDDEFTLGTTEDRDEAVKMARDEWRYMNDYDKRHNKIEVRIYEEDIEREDCQNFDYNTIPWQIWTAERATDTLIDQFGTYAEAEHAIEGYEEIDKEEAEDNGEAFEKNFYDVVNENHEHIER